MGKLASLPTLLVHPHLVLLSSIMITAVAGTILFFPSFAHLLSPPLKLTTFQTSVIVSVAICGSLSGMLCGAIHAQCGTRGTALLGLLLIFAGYTWTMLLVLAEKDSKRTTGDFVAMVLSALLINNGSSLSYLAGLMAVSSAFYKKHHDKLYGLISSIFALSSGLCGMLQKRFFNNVGPLMVFLSFSSGIAIIFALFINGAISKTLLFEYFQPIYFESTDRKISWVFFVIASITSILIYHGYSESRGSLQHEEVWVFLTLSLFCSLWMLVADVRPAVGVLYDRGSLTNREKKHSVTTEASSALSWRHKSRKYGSFDREWREHTVSRDRLHDTMQLAFSTRYVSLFLIISIAYGTSMTLLSNAHGLILSRAFVPSSAYDGKSFFASTFHFLTRRSNGSLVLFSTCSVLGRLFVGFALGLDRYETFVRKEAYLLLNLIVMMCGFVFAIFVPFKLVFLPFVFLGFSFGSVAVLAPVLIDTWFGEEMLAALYGFMGLALTSGGLILPNALFQLQQSISSIYPKVKLLGRNSTRVYCIGSKCFTLTFVIDLFLCLLSVLLSLHLLNLPRDRKSTSEHVEQSTQSA